MLAIEEAHEGRIATGWGGGQAAGPCVLRLTSRVVLHGGGVIWRTRMCGAQAATRANGACARMARPPAPDAPRWRDPNSPALPTGWWWCPRSQDPFARGETLAPAHPSSPNPASFRAPSSSEVGRRARVPPPAWRPSVTSAASPRIRCYKKDSCNARIHGASSDVTLSPLRVQR